MGIPRAKKAKKNPKLYTEEDVERRVTSMQEIYKAIMYLYLAEVRKWKPSSLMTLDKHFAKWIMALYGGKLTFKDLQNLCEKHGVDMRAIGRNTERFVNKYGKEWGL